MIGNSHENVEYRVLLVYSSEVLNSEDLSSAIYWILSILNNCVFCTVLYCTPCSNNTVIEKKTKPDR